MLVSENMQDLVGCALHILKRYRSRKVLENLPRTAGAMKFGCLNSKFIAEGPSRFSAEKNYDGVGTQAPLEGNIDVPKYTKILKPNLKPNAAKHFLKSLLFPE